ncbi:MAG TPA: hypothetical protein VGJ77_15255 [Gaiellaceae bacterium]
MTLGLGPFAPVQRPCGLGASGCYAPADGTIVAAADALRVDRTGAAGGGAYTIDVSRP